MSAANNLASNRSNSRLSSRLNQSRDFGLESKRSKLAGNVTGLNANKTCFFKKREMITLLKLLANDDIYVKKKECR